MTSAASDLGQFRFSTDALPERDRLAGFREWFGRKIARIEFEPLTEEFHADVTLRSLGNLGLATVDHSLMRVGRTRELLSDGNDALILLISTGGCHHASQLGRETALEPGEAILLSSADVGTFVCSSTGAKSLMITLSHRQLRPLIRAFDLTLMHRISAQAQALQLLTSYVGIFEDAPVLSPELQRLAIDHVYDLVAVMLGATRDAAELARGRGLQAARLRALKADILANLSGERGLSLGALAERHKISPVYIRKLFQGEDTSFTQFVLEQRLVRAHDMLSEYREADRTISSLALEAGFNDMSYFNRAFRRRYGASPSDVRAEHAPR